MPCKSMNDLQIISNMQENFYSNVMYNILDGWVGGISLRIYGLKLKYGDKSEQKIQRFFLCDI
jgi:hypothetical protein